MHPPEHATANPRVVALYVIAQLFLMFTRGLSAASRLLAVRLAILRARGLGLRHRLHMLALRTDMTWHLRLVGSPGRAARWHLIPRFGHMIPLLVLPPVLFRSFLVTIPPPIGGMQL